MGIYADICRHCCDLTVNLICNCRISTGHLEDAITKHPDVAEAAVVGLPDRIKGHVPIGFCVLGAGNISTKLIICNIDVYCNRIYVVLILRMIFTIQSSR